MKTIRTAPYPRTVSTPFLAGADLEIHKIYPAVVASVSNGRATVTMLKRPEKTTRHPDMICSLVVEGFQQPEWSYQHS